MKPKFETIYEACLALRSLEQLEDILSETLKISQKLLGYDTCAILLLNAKVDRLFVKAHMDSGNLIIQDANTAIELKGILGQVAKTGHSMCINYASPIQARLPKFQIARSQIAVPLMTRGEVIGILSAESQRASESIDDDVKAFSIIADTVAKSLESVIMLNKLTEQFLKLKNKRNDS